MIALISSTVFPPPATGETSYRATISPEERIVQTKKTVESLVRLGYKKIFLADNSGFNWVEGTESQFQPAKVIRLNTFQFNNKGMSEIHLLMAAIPALPDNEPILKISGRYTIDRTIDEQSFRAYDVIGKRQGKTMSTRAYYVRDRQVLQALLRECLEMMYSQGAKIVGPKSLIKFVKNYFSPSFDQVRYSEPQVMIEMAISECVRKKYRYLDTQQLGIHGILAGSPGASEHIRE